MRLRQQGQGHRPEERPRQQGQGHHPEVGPRQEVRHHPEVGPRQEVHHPEQDREAGHLLLVLPRQGDGRPLLEAEPPHLEAERLHL